MPPVDRNNATASPALGFLTVVNGQQDGLFGGYLVLNLLGRPLEFHCTAPIRPNRAQEILYGPTLEPYLYGEQIGQALLEKAKTSPMVLCTDQRPALAVRPLVDVPVVLVLPQEEDAPGEHLSEFRLGRNRLAVPVRYWADREAIAQRLAEVAESFDLAEPFGRIREAIDEARSGGP